MTTEPETKPTPFVMVYAKDNGFIERDLSAATREEAKAEGMGVVRVLGIDRGYIMERESETIFHSFP